MSFEILLLLVFLTGLGVPSAAEQEAQAVGPSLDELVARSAREHPAILSAQARVEGLRTREDQRAQPFDPMLSAGLMSLPWQTFALDEEGMTGVQLSIGQRFHWPGTLDARAASARAEAQAEQAMIPDRIVGLWLDAIPPYHRLVSLERRQAVLIQQHQLLTTLKNTSRALFDAGTMELAEVLRTETAVSHLDQLLLEVVREKRISIAEINGLLGRSLDAPVPVPLDPDPIPTRGDLDHWLSEALRTHPAFRALDLHEAVLLAQRQEAETEDNPMIDVALSWTFRFQDGPAGRDMVSLMLGLPLPFFSARGVDARLDELDAGSLQLDWDRQEMIRRLRAAIGTHLEALDSLEEEIASLRQTLIPQLREVYESALAHYPASHIDVEVLIEIQARLLDLELMQADLLTQHDMHRAYLQALTVDSAAIRSLWEIP